MTERSQKFESLVRILIPSKKSKRNQLWDDECFSKQSDSSSYPPGNSLVRMNHDTEDPQVTVADYYFALCDVVFPNQANNYKLIKMRRSTNSET
jgi:uncharacterized protein YozE (UPF0346 family)